MSQSYDLFCRWKHVQKIQSDNAGAIALGVTRASVSSWKKGKNAEIQFIERMAEDIGDNPETWSALVMAERSNSEDERAAWKRIAQRLAGVTLGLFMVMGAALPGRAEASVDRDAIHTSQSDKPHALYIMRSRTVDAPVRPCGLSLLVPPQEADWTMTLDTYDRVDLTGPWAGFGFQGHRFFTPEGRDIDPVGMRYWSLTCNIAREWALMMAEERQARGLELEATKRTLELDVAGKACATRVLKSKCSSSNVIYLREVLRARREKRLSSVDGAGSADRSTVVRRTRGPRAPRRG